MLIYVPNGSLMKVISKYLKQSVFQQKFANKRVKHLIGERGNCNTLSNKQMLFESSVPFWCKYYIEIFIIPFDSKWLYCLHVFYTEHAPATVLLQAL